MLYELGRVFIRRVCYYVAYPLQIVAQKVGGVFLPLVVAFYNVGARYVVVVRF